MKIPILPNFYSSVAPTAIIIICNNWYRDLFLGYASLVLLAILAACGFCDIMANHHREKLKGQVGGYHLMWRSDL